MLIILRNARGEMISQEAHGENFSQAISNLLLQDLPSVDLFAKYYLNAAETLEANGYDDGPNELADEASEIALEKTGYYMVIVTPCYSIV